MGYNHDRYRDDIIAIPTAINHTVNNLQIDDILANTKMHPIMLVNGTPMQDGREISWLMFKYLAEKQFITPLSRHDSNPMYVAAA